MAVAEDESTGFLAFNADVGVYASVNFHHHLISLFFLTAQSLPVPSHPRAAQIYPQRIFFNWCCPYKGRIVAKLGQLLG